MASPELRLLGRWTNTNTASTGRGKSPNTQWQPAPQLETSPALPQGMLNGKQVGEVRYAVVHSPVTSTGVAEDLEYVQLVLDGNPYPHIWLSGRQDTSMAPPPSRIRHGRIIEFGKPLVGRNGNPASLLDATCPKFISSVVPLCYAGATAITQDYTVDLYGYVYDSIDLVSWLPSYSPPDEKIVDRLNNRSFVVKGRTITPTGGDWKSAWLKLPGGSQQADQPINAFIRRARNSNATTANQGYIFQYQNSSDSPAVPNPQDNLYFTVGSQQALLLERMGVVGPEAPNSGGYDVLSAWIQCTSENQQRHPAGGIPAGYNLGITRFGLVTGQTNLFDGVPDLPQGQQLLTDETAYATVVDNGTSIPADDIMVALVAKLVGTSNQGV